MASKRSVVITLKLDENSNQSNVSNQTNTVDNSFTGNNLQKAATGFVSGVVVNQVAKQTFSIIMDAALFQYEQRLIKNDDYIGQRNKNIALMGINKLYSAGKTIGMGFALGGPAGGIAAAIAVAINGAHDVIEGFKKQEEQKLMLRQMDAQLQFTRERAGWSLNAASIGDNL